MTRQVVTVAEAAPYKSIVELLAERQISAVPVTDPAGTVVGVVSEADLLKKVEHESSDEPVRLLDLHRSAKSKATGTTARAVMTSPAVTVGPEDSVVTAAQLMDRRNVKRLPVVDVAGRLVGIVSRRDLLSVFLESDDAIKDEIVRDVLQGVMWLEPSAVEVTVRDGVVSLDGEVEQKSLADITVRLCRGVDGVVNVISALRYRVDDTRIRVTSPLLGGF
jgi:CBS domain-containing protein